MRMALLVLTFLITPVSWANEHQCLEKATNYELLQELERRLYTVKPGPGSDTLNVNCACGVEGAADTYEIWVTGTTHKVSELAKVAKKQCKFSQFGGCQVVRPAYAGLQILTCECGKAGASDTYKVSGSGITLGEAYEDVVTQCKWRPIVRTCRQG